MTRRKGTPCGCNADPCGCSPKNHCVKAINNVSPDPNGDLTIKAGSGIGINQTGDNEITIVNTSDPDTFIEGKNIEFTPVGDDLEISVVDDPVIDGTLTVNGDIIQNGAAYETHAEKVYTTNDYIYMRENAIAGLPTGSYSGFEVIKYDGTNNGRLVMDKDGVARVGDVGDEEPLLTRDETADLTDGALLKWDATGAKAINEGTVGSDTKPVKIVNGVATEVTDNLQKEKTSNGFTSTATYPAGDHLLGSVISQPVGSTIIMTIRIFTQNISTVTLGVRVNGANQYWVQTTTTDGSDYRFTATLVSKASSTRTLQAEMYTSQNIVAEYNVDYVILP